MRLDVGRWIELVWMLVGLFWLIGALRLKPVAHREERSSWIFHVAIMTVACGLLFSSSTRFGLLGARVVPESNGIGWAGLCLTVAGCAFAV